MMILQIGLVDPPIGLEGANFPLAVDLMSTLKIFLTWIAVKFLIFEDSFPEYLHIVSE